MYSCCVLAHSAICPARLTLLPSSLFFPTAKALGQVEIDLSSMQVDAYVSNGHKWLYSPKGSAFLWVSPSLQSPSTTYQPGYVYPVIISNEGQGKTEFTKLFSYEGTKARLLSSATGRYRITRTLVLTRTTPRF
jgi:hypothetical protein